MNDLPEDIHDLQDYALYLESEKHALEAQLAADAWTLLIDDKGRAVEGALPKTVSPFLVSCVNPVLDKPEVHIALYIESGWHDLNWRPMQIKVYAYKPWPAPAPYPVREEE